MKEKIQLLQLFAEDGSAAETGVAGADAGHERLLELGVPADKLKNERAYQIPEPRKESDVQDAAAQDSEVSHRMSWDEVCADPEYREKMQQMVRQRVKHVKHAQDALETLQPALQMIARNYGLDGETLDYAALSNAIRGDDRLYEDQAKQLGVTPALARRLDRMEAIQQSQHNSLRNAALKDHYQDLLRQGQTLQQQLPGFDIRKELTDPAFLRLTAPNVGLSVEDAYYALHRQELQQQTALQISNAIRSGSMRPEENGMGAHGPAVTTFDYRNASREQREALKQAIRAAGARGEKLYPGATGP